MKFHGVSITILTFILAGVFCFSLEAVDLPDKSKNLKTVSPKQPQKSTIQRVDMNRGYCCVEGEVMAVGDQNQCKAKQGRYFKTRNDADKECTGVCCVAGQIEEMHPKSCQAKRGVYFGSEKEARQKCKGYCCKDGSITQKTQLACKQQGGSYFGDERTARAQCSGFCCDDYEVAGSTEQQCRAAQGRYFGTENEADKYCDNQRVFCCIDGKVSTSTVVECRSRKGAFFPAVAEANRNCKQQQGYCNVNNRTLRLTEEDCKKRQGLFYTKQLSARKDLVQSRKDLSADRLQPGNRLPAASVPSARRVLANRFGFIHPSEGEIFSQDRPRFSWRPHHAADKYFIRIMETGSGAGSHRTIWSRGNITATSIAFNSDGSASAALMPGKQYRANLYARTESQITIPNDNPDEYLQMTGDVTFTVAGNDKAMPRELIKTDRNKPVKLVVPAKAGGNAPSLAPLQAPSKGLVPVPGKIDAGKMVTRSIERGYRLSVNPSQDEYVVGVGSGMTQVTVSYIYSDTEALETPPEQMIIELYHPSSRVRSGCGSCSHEINTVESGVSGEQRFFLPSLDEELPNWSFRLRDSDSGQLLAQTDSFTITSGGLASLDVFVTQPAAGDILPLQGDITVKFDQAMRTTYPLVRVVFSKDNQLVYSDPYPGPDGFSVNIETLGVAPGEYYYFEVQVPDEGGDGFRTVGQSGTFSFFQVLLQQVMEFHDYKYSIELSATELQGADRLYSTAQKSDPDFIPPERMAIELIDEANESVRGQFLFNENWMHEPRVWFMGHSGSYHIRIVDSDTGAVLGRSSTVRVTGSWISGIVTPSEGGIVFADDSFEVKFMASESALRNLVSITMVMTGENGSPSIVYEGTFYNRGGISYSYRIPMDFAGEHRDLQNTEVSLRIEGNYRLEGEEDLVPMNLGYVRFRFGGILNPDFIVGLMENYQPRIEQISCKTLWATEWTSPCEMNSTDNIIAIWGENFGNEPGTVRLSWNRNDGPMELASPPIEWSDNEVRLRLTPRLNVDTYRESISLHLTTEYGKDAHYYNAVRYTPPSTSKFLCTGGFRHYGGIIGGEFNWNYNLRNGWQVIQSGTRKSGGSGNRCRWTNNRPESGDTFLPTMLREIDPHLGNSGGCVAWVELEGPDNISSGIPANETLYDDRETCIDATGYH